MMKGNVRVVCRYSLYVGPDHYFSLLFPLLCTLGAVLFLTYTSESRLARLLAALLLVLTLVTWSFAAFRNPGVIERDESDAAVSAERRPRWITVPLLGLDERGERRTFRVEQRWCFTCHLYRPLRSVHCRFCDVCVHRRDHHCPWIGTCVGARNLLYFYAMLWSLLSYVLTVTLSSSIHILQRSQRISAKCRGDAADTNCATPAFFRAMGETLGIEMAMAVFGYAVILFVSLTIWFQTRLISRNQVMADEARYGSENIFHQGSVWRNVLASFTFSPRQVALYETEVASKENAPTPSTSACPSPPPPPQPTPPLTTTHRGEEPTHADAPVEIYVASPSEGEDDTSPPSSLL